MVLMLNIDANKWIYLKICYGRCSNYLSRRNSTLKARACQSTIGLTSVCPLTEINDHAMSLGWNSFRTSNPAAMIGFLFLMNTHSTWILQAFIFPSWAYSVFSHSRTKLVRIFSVDYLCHMAVVFFPPSKIIKMF